jgi:hypothetical protein
MPSSAAARAIRIAISPRFAISSLRAGAALITESCVPIWSGN